MTSLKKLLIAGLVVPAFVAAQDKPAEAKPSVTVYGTINVNLQTTRAQGVAARWAVSTDSSNVGVKGTADLRHGVGVTFQCETSAAVDGISVAGICGRNSRVGVTHKYGTLFYGNWDTPFKSASYGTRAEDPFGFTDVFGYQGIMGSPGFNYRSGAFVSATGAAPAAATNTPFPAGSVVNGFDLRAQNSVGYWSPKYEGVSAKVQYSTDEFRSSKGIIAPQLYSAAVNFDRGPFSVFASYDMHEDAGGLVAINVPAAGTATAKLAFGATDGNSAGKSSSDAAWRIGAGYELASPAGATTVSAMYEQIKFAQDSATTGQVKEFSRPAWQVAAKHKWKDHEVRARFSMAGEGDCTVVGGSCSTASYGANMFALGYAYQMAKSTQVYLSYVQIENQKNAQYTLTIGGSSAVAGATAKGTDPRALGLGIKVGF